MNGAQSEAVRQARALAQRVLPRALAAESERRVPRENIDDLRATALLQMAVPKLFGGTELGWSTVVECGAELARGCPSTAWLFGVFVGHIWLASQFPLEAQREVFDASSPLISAVVRLGGNPPRREGSGYRIAGAEGRFCSGIHFADWVIVGATADPQTEPDSRLYLLPKSDVQIIDDWNTVGMRGTGSCSIRIDDAFVPEYRTVRVPEIMRATSPGMQAHTGTFYRAPFPDAVGLTLIGIPLGIARAATECFAQSLREKFQSMESEQLAEQGQLFARLSDADADVAAATALIYADARRLDDAPDPRALPPADIARMRRNLAYAAHRCRFAVTSLFEGGGGLATYDASTLQRLWRDMNAAASHAMFSSEAATPAYARLYLGLPPARFARRTANA